MLFPVTALGPGNRVGLWTLGCKKRCKLCANPELRRFDSSRDISVAQFKKMLEAIELSRVDGFTVSGGEPFCQPKGLYEFLCVMRDFSEDILVFSGYTMKELQKIDDIYVSKSLQLIDILVAGEYINELNDNKTVLIGSTNQMMYCFNDNLLERYEAYAKKGRQIQNVFYQNNMISLGIHNREEKKDD